MVGTDWKVKIDVLNPRAYFFISPQYYMQHLVDYPGFGHVGTYTGDILYQNNYTTSLLINTTYLHNKLQPQIFWLRDWSNKSEFWKPQVAYEYSDHWKYTVGAMIFSGEKHEPGHAALQLQGPGIHDGQLSLLRKPTTKKEEA